MILHTTISDTQVRKAIRNGLIAIGGNRKLKIFGNLNCTSGKRMKRAHRVFFDSEKEAILMGFRPCGHCLKKKFESWKQSRG